MMDDAWVVLWFILAGAFILPYTLCIIDRIFVTHLSCSMFGWHNGKGSSNRTFDGCSVHATCSKCDKEVMQDSQGNWF